MTTKYLKSAERSKKAPTLAAWDLPFADEDRVAFASSALRQRRSPERRPSRSRLLTRTWGICTRRAGKLDKARSPLYRRQMLQQNMRWKALAEIYQMSMVAKSGFFKSF